MDGIKRARQQVLEAGREMLKKGLVAATWGNISCRVEGENCIAITPSGMEYDILTEEDIVVVDMQGKVVSGHRRPSIEVPLHLHLYEKREDIGAIVHTHSTYATALACAHKHISPIVEELAQVAGGDVRVAKYALPGSQLLATNVVTALRDRYAVLLANHGMIGVAKNLKEALKVCEIVEKGAKITILCNVIGQPVPISFDDVQTMRRTYVTDYGQRET
ncbi:MAG: class II aldolase/adducin family protein [Clostridia bacterium]|nr:class II aldolase/adducin family protein [Clostridiales bacterium]